MKYALITFNFLIFIFFGFFSLIRIIESIVTKSNGISWYIILTITIALFSYGNAYYIHESLQSNEKFFN